MLLTGADQQLYTLVDHPVGSMITVKTRLLLVMHTTASFECCLRASAK